ncbi:MAG: hypothetical protein ACRDTE_09510 [Pseudonocardiaceae bacterium]
MSHLPPLSPTARKWDADAIKTGPSAIAAELAFDDWLIDFTASGIYTVRQVPARIGIGAGLAYELVREG